MARRNALRGTNFKEALPEYAPHFDAMVERLDVVGQKYTAAGVVLDVSLAEELISELYVDAGHPVLNAAAQDHIIDAIIAKIARWDSARLPDGARQALTNGVLEYVRAGGGQYAPSSEADLASALDRLAPDDAAAQEAVGRLLADALTWADAVGSEVQRDSARNEAQKHWGPAFELSAYEAESGASPLPANRPERFDKAVAALAALVSDPPPDAGRLQERLRAATDSALASFKESQLNDDLTCRLLITYRSLLARRPMIAARPADFIENRLLWLAVKSDRLTSDRHWRLWVQAVTQLKAERMSKGLQEYIRVSLKSKDLPEARRTILAPLRPLVAN